MDTVRATNGATNLQHTGVENRNKPVKIYEYVGGLVDRYVDGYVGILKGLKGEARVKKAIGGKKP